MMKFNWEEFLNKENKIAVHCKTEEEANDFCKQMHEHGLKWNDGCSYLNENCFDNYTEDTCYTLIGQYCTCIYYEKRGYKILEWSEYMQEEKKEFAKADLRTGMIVTLIDGTEWVVVLDVETKNFKGDAIIQLGHVVWGDLSRLLDKNICDINGFKSSDIVKVEISDEPCWIFNLRYGKARRTVLYERKEIIITQAEKTILENRNRLYNWIARDKDGEMALFEKKPFKVEDGIQDSWVCETPSSSFCNLDCFMHLFPFVNWEDEEPWNIEELLKVAKVEG